MKIQFSEPNEPNKVKSDKLECKKACCVINFLAKFSSFTMCLCGNVAYDMDTHLEYCELRIK